MMLGALFIFLVCCTTIPAHSRDGKNAAEIRRLVAFMEGQFTSLEHARDDSTIVPTLWNIDRIWWDRTDGAWLLWRSYPYIRDSTPAPEPSEVCVIQIHEIEHGLIEQAFWDVRTPFIGSTFDQDSSVVEQLRTKDALSKRRGCEIIYQIGADFYLGRTVGMACVPPKDMNAAALLATWRVRPMWIELLTQGINSVGDVVAGRRGKPVYFMRTDDARAGRQ